MHISHKPETILKHHQEYYIYGKETFALYCCVKNDIETLDKTLSSFNKKYNQQHLDFRFNSIPMIHNAAYYGHLNIMKLLVEKYNFDIKLQSSLHDNKLYRTQDVLYYCVIGDHVDVLQYCMKYMKRNDVKYSYMLLQLAVCYHSNGCLECLIENGYGDDLNQGSSEKIYEVRSALEMIMDCRNHDKLCAIAYNGLQKYKAHVFDVLENIVMKPNTLPPEVVAMIIEYSVDEFEHIIGKYSNDEIDALKNRILHRNAPPNYAIF